ncbi:MAG: DNA primase [Microthrixaceae bacterium]
MGIVDEDIGRVREATDIVAVISQYTQLKRSGVQWQGLCPFHTEKSGSFYVNPSKGVYFCHGCKVSGDIITFIREKEQLDFAAAVEWLANRSGVTLRYTERDEGEGRKRQARLLDVVERATEWYHQRLRTAPDAAAARAYLRGRGFTGEEVAHYRVGWAPDGWDAMARSLRISRDDLEASGLGFQNKAGRLQDFFRARILFPIMDERGRVIGFGGRKMPDADGAKYQNSRDNELYHKSKALYGLNWAKADAVNAGEMVICEGYTDVIGFARAGIPRAIATCGTSLTEDHVKMIRRFTRRLVLAYDADDAGRTAADRVYAWEQTHDLEVSVVVLPPGADPDELARTAPDTLGQAVKDARPFLAFRVDRVLAAADLRTVEGRARAAEAALAVVAEHPNDMVRDQYLMEVADSCRVDAGLLRDRLVALRNAPRPVDPEPGRAPRRDDGGRRGEQRRGDDRWGDGEPLPEERPGEYWDGPASAGPRRSGGGRPERAARPERGPERLRDGAETEALRLVLQHPEVVDGFLEPALFLHPTTRRAFEAVSTGAPLTEVLDDVPPEVGTLLARLAVEPSEAESLDVLSRLATEVGRVVMAELEAEARSSPDPLAYASSIAWLKVTLDEVRSPKAEVETVTQLLAWLADRRRVVEQG